ncbi:DUF4334 domain-containing protein [Ramlibacter sp. AN1015]|uniref:DUF4334 domain-containing protein n=1 Tax=Ramlibacter sp. AN1015 TaxID=3133428 RepID=UPI0030BE0CCA
MTDAVPLPASDFAHAVSRGHSSTADALSLFDALSAVPLESMLGRWSGAGFPTGHWLDGLLEASGWSGKRFDSTEQVHPLEFATGTRNPLRLRATGAPLALSLLRRFPRLRAAAAGGLGRAALPLLATTRSQARLRTLVFRGVPSAAMLYDSAPIIDVFRGVDADTVLGLMDMKGMDQPFFFVLRRAG